MDQPHEQGSRLSHNPGAARFSARAKILREKNGEQDVWKGRIETRQMKEVAHTRHSVLENTDVKITGTDIEKRLRFNALLHHSRERKEIETRIQKRQEGGKMSAVGASSRGNLNVNEAQEHRPASLSKEDEPPPRSVSVPVGVLQGKPQENISGGKTKTKQLVYRSDFTQPTGWDEEHSEHVSVVRYDGVYHMAVFRPARFGYYYAYFSPSLVLGNDFLATVDVCIKGGSGRNAVCGLAFGIHGTEDTEVFDSFVVASTGVFRLVGQVGEASHWKESEYVNRGGGGKHTSVTIKRRNE